MYYELIINKCVGLLSSVQEILFPLWYIGILIMIRALIKPATQPALSFPVGSLSSFSINTKHSLYVVSNGLNVNSVMTKIAADLNNMDYQVFATESAALDAYTANKSQVAAGVIFGYGNNLTIHQYAIRMPKESIADTKKVFTDGENQGTVCVLFFMCVSTIIWADWFVTFLQQSSLCV